MQAKPFRNFGFIVAFSLMACVNALCLNNYGYGFFGVAEASETPSKNGDRLDELLQGLFNLTMVSKIEVPTPTQQIERWTGILDIALEATMETQLSPSFIEQFRLQTQKVRDEALLVKNGVAEGVLSTERLIESLGAVPLPEAPPETKEVEENRKKLNKQLSEAKSLVAQVDLIIARATEIDKAFGDLGRATLQQELQSRLPAPLLPSTLIKAAADGNGMLKEIWVSLEAFGHGIYKIHNQGWQWIYPLLIVSILMIGGFLGQAFILKNYGRDDKTIDPTYAKRLFVTGGEVLARWAMPALLLGGIALFLQDLRPEMETIESHGIATIAYALLENITYALLIFFGVTGFIRSVIAPYRMSWRLTTLTTASCHILRRQLKYLCGLCCIAAFLYWSRDLMDPSPEVISVGGLVLITALCIVVIALASKSGWQRIEAYVRTTSKTGLEPPSSLKSLMRLACVLAATLAFFAAIFGYHLIAIFTLRNLILTATLLVTFLVLRGLLQEILVLLFRSPALGKAIAVKAKSFRLVVMLIRTIVDPLLLFGGFVLIAPSWGISHTDILSWTTYLVAGFKVGNITISPMVIVLGIVSFFVSWSVTRFIQRFLLEKILPLSGLNEGVQFAIAGGFMYIGLFFSIALAIAVLGIDLSSLALVAGALSVGIGFGLRDLVSNFISGLILLVERPIKVGDFVLIDNELGTVRKISLRATEVETLEWSTIIVPNADILSRVMTNWTHHDRAAMIKLKVPVRPDENLSKVRQIMVEAALWHPMVLKNPTPYVLMQTFEIGVLWFEMQCYITKVNRARFIESDLNFEIEKRLRANYIYLPKPQQMVHIAKDGYQNMGEPASEDILRNRNKGDVLQKPKDAPAVTEDFPKYLNPTAIDDI